jgi:hypothetical protein
MREAWLPQPRDFGSFANPTQVTADPREFSWLLYREMLIGAEYWNTRQKLRPTVASPPRYPTPRHQNPSSRSG